MKLQDDIEFNTLNWVKPELDRALTRAREALEEYVDDDNARALQDCAAELHQVLGTLRMVELYGAALVIQEMEELVVAVREDHVTRSDEVYSALMKGMMQIPDYLERLQTGYRDIPIVLLPLINDLRGCRNVQELHESELFQPDLTVALPTQAPGAPRSLSAEEQQREVGVLRLRFQQSLLTWFRGTADTSVLNELRDTLDLLTACCHTLAGRRLWWIASGVLDGLVEGVLDAHSKEVKQLVGRVDRCIRTLLENGESALAEGEAVELAHKLLYYVARAQSGSLRLNEVYSTYQLAQFLPDEEEVDHARGAMAGHNRELLDTVSQAIKDDLLNVKDALDLFLHTSADDPGQLGHQAEVLDRVGDTLGMLGLAVPQRVIGEQRAALQSAASGEQVINENELLDVAGALLYVEASLDDHIQRLGAEDADEAGEGGMPQSETRNVLATVIKEANANVDHVKQMLTAFVESGWDHTQLDGAPALLEEACGALGMIDAERPVQLVTGIARFIHNELVVDRRVPGLKPMEHLADALASVEYYLEAAAAQQGGLGDIMAVTQRSLEQLGYWPVPEARTAQVSTAPEVAAANVSDTADEPAVPEPEPEQSDSGRESATVVPFNAPPAEASHGKDDAVGAPDAAAITTESELTPGSMAAEPPHTSEDTHEGPDARADVTDDEELVEVEEEVAELDEMALRAGFQDAGEEVDDDIRDVFQEEVQEELDGMREVLPDWLAAPDDSDKLTPIRRAFHTLKGSGRLVGAAALGEFSWQVENMLNRVLDATIDAHAGVRDVVQHATDALPEFIKSLRTDEPADAPVKAIADAAERIAAGETDVTVEKLVREQPTRTVTRVVRRRVSRDEAPESAAVTDAAADESVHMDAPAPGVESQSDLDDAAATTDDASESAKSIADDADGQDAHPEAPVLPPIDPVLSDILRSEVEQHLGVIRASMDNADGGAVSTDESLLRAVHTMHGAIAMVDVPFLSELLSPLESWLKRLRALDRPIPAHQVPVLTQTVTAIAQVTDQLNAEQPSLPETGELAQQLEQWRDDLPEPEVSHPIYGQDAEGDTPSAEATAEAPAVADDPTLPGVEITGLDVSGDGIPTAQTLRDDVPTESVGEPVAEEPVAEEPVAEEPAAEEPAAEEPAAEEPAAEEPVAEEPVAEEPVAEEPVAEEPVAKEPVAEEPVAEEPVAEEPVAKEPVAEEPVAEEPVAEEPVAEEPVAEEPVAEEPVAEEPVAEEPVAEEPVAEEAAAAPASGSLGRLSADYYFPDEAQPEGALVLEDSDEELLDLFVEENTEMLDQADGTLAALRENPDAQNMQVALQRDLHTVKGGARMGSLTQIGDLTHAMESLLEATVAGRLHINADILESLERGFDYLHDMVARVKQRRALARPDRVIAHFEQLLKQTGSGSDDTASTSSGDAETATAGGHQIHRGATEETPESSAESQPELLPETDTQTDATQEMIRVRSDRVDSLINHAGEVSIYRTRLEQQVSGFRFNLGEFDQTLTRLREQLRQLEIETEAQIIARYQHEGYAPPQTSESESAPADADAVQVSAPQDGADVSAATVAQDVGEASNNQRFDPLELDRFSQLQQYSRALTESMADLDALKNMLEDNARQSETLLLQQSRVTSDLQEGLMRTRMVAFDSIVPTLRRTVRQAGQETGKRAQLHVTGAYGELDRNLLERLKSPFEHMLRNSLSHGIETPEERRSAGKPEEGTVNVTVGRDATEVTIEVSDDGAGMNRDAIRERAIERGWLNPDAEISDSALFAFVLESGFSTSDEVTQLAGRGVGMDVVANEIKQVGGTLDIESAAGKGTTLHVRVPFTLAVAQAVLVKIGDATFAVPLTSVQGVSRIKPDEKGRDASVSGGNFVYAGEEYSIHDLSALLDIPAGHVGEDQQQPVLLVHSEDMRAAVCVDAVLGSREIVVKRVGPQVSSVPGIFGATVTGEGSVMLILDPAPLVRHDMADQGRAFASEPDAEAIDEEQVPAGEQPQAHAAADHEPTIMVVDDSITMRKVAGRILERHGYAVTTATDGMDAVEKLQERVPDLMLLDIEMPRMDGYEVATHMKNDTRLAPVPIIMITSRSGEKHKQRAFDIGVDRYVGKPYQENDLIRQIGELVEGSA